MSLKRLKYRVKSAKPIARAILRCHRLEFHKISKDGSGKCDIVLSSAADVVWGRLYYIDDKEKERLDCVEGLGCGYFEKCVTVEMDCGSTVCAVTYYANPTKTNSCLKPYTWYKKHVLIGAKEAYLPAGYIRCIEEIEAIEDRDKCREEDELKIYTPAQLL
jgi:hypothetical protein